MDIETIMSLWIWVNWNKLFYHGGKSAYLSM